MSYIVYHKDSTILLFGYNKSFANLGSARRALNAKIAWERDDFAICDRDYFFEKIEKKVIRTNLMSKKPFETGINTPVYMDPSCETYWSM